MKHGCRALAAAVGVAISQADRSVQTALVTPPQIGLRERYAVDTTIHNGQKDVASIENELIRGL